MKWTLTICAVALVVCVVVLAGCQSANMRPVNLNPAIEIATPVVVKLFVPEPWKTVALLVLAGLGGGVVGRKTKRNE